MRTTYRIGIGLTLVGIVLLIVANRWGREASNGAPASVPPERIAKVVPAVPPREPVPAPRESGPGDPPTIFEALLSVIDSTDEGRVIDEEQRDQMRQELIETNKAWRRMKVEMKESIRNANARFVTDPERDAPAAPAP